MGYCVQFILSVFPSSIVKPDTVFITASLNYGYAYEANKHFMGIAVNAVKKLIRTLWQ